MPSLKKTPGQTLILIMVSIFLLLTCNHSLWSRLLEIYPLASGHNRINLFAIVVFFTTATMGLFLLLLHGKIGKWLLIIIVTISSLSAYYMDSYGVVIDLEMIRNIAETNPGEMAGLFSISMAIKFLLFGLIPAILIARFWTDYKLDKLAKLADRKLRLKSLAVLTLLLVASVCIAPANFASFVREHKITRLYSNPMGWVYSAIAFSGKQFKSSTSHGPIQETAKDAAIIGEENQRELIILVVGETARADRFSLNGYGRETNPELKKRQVLSFSNVSSCGTSTGESVPCMFSALSRKNFTREKSQFYKNALDVLFDKGVQVIWRDNNSDSKGVATRVKYENFRSPNNNPLCDPECRDLGMLHNLDKYIDARKGKDILIVLHQMGNHGPEYFRRYPQEFEYFQPACKTKELGNCTAEQVNNAYDNAIRYTDYFLAQLIDFLKKYDNTHATAMLYVSDHGESLGEHGIYLHAAPYSIAPKEQTHIPVILWTGKNFDYPIEMIKPYQDMALSHDDLYCSLLIAFEVKTQTCEIKNYWLNHNPEIETLKSPAVMPISEPDFIANSYTSVVQAK